MMLGKVSGPGQVSSLLLKKKIGLPHKATLDVCLLSQQRGCFCTTHCPGGFAHSGFFGSLHYPFNGMPGGEGFKNSAMFIELLLVPQVIS